VLAGELIREAEQLVNKKIHPQTIIEGYRRASKIAYQALIDSTEDRSSNPEQFKEDLLKTAMTSLSSKILSSNTEMFASLAVEAVLRLQVLPFYFLSL